MDIQEERKWWEMRVQYPFAGDLQKHLDEFQEKLIAACEPSIEVPDPDPQTLCKAILGFDL